MSSTNGCSGSILFVFCFLTSAHLEGFDWNSCLVLLLHHLDEFGHDLVHHVVDVSAPLKHTHAQRQPAVWDADAERRRPRGDTAADLGGGDAVDEADLLESLLAHGETNLPAIVHRLIHHLERHPGLVQLVLHVQIHVAAEAGDLVGGEGEGAGSFNG